MPHAFHFIAGLPRSGSTLLSAILRQNPRFHAGMTGPVGSMIDALLRNMSMSNEFSVFTTDAQREALLRSVFATFYADIPDHHVVFDSNRMWCARLPLISSLFPQARVVCCVRDIPWILDSIERLIRKNKFQPSGIFNFETGGTSASVRGREKVSTTIADSPSRLRWPSMTQWTGSPVASPNNSSHREPGHDASRP